MNGVDAMTGWRNLKQRLSFKGLGGCCGATWSPGGGAPSDPLAVTIIPHPQHHHDEEDDEEDEFEDLEEEAGPPTSDGGGGGGMNLAMALARERNSSSGPATKSLMRLIEETDGVDLGGRSGAHRVGERENSPAAAGDWSCCVCMERSKGAAFIPCGHAFCRVCSRELWLNRGSCPVCNRSILDVLDIF